MAVRFGAEIRARRNRLDLSQEELAERAKLHRNTVGKIERDANTPGDVGEKELALLAQALQTTVEELKAGSTSEAQPRRAGALRPLDDDALIQLAKAMNLTPTEAARRLGRPAPPVEADDLPMGMKPVDRMVPLLGSVSAGNWLERVGLPADEHTPRAYAHGVKDPGAFALIVDGDSMTPTYTSGDEIVVVPTLPRELVENEDVVIQLSGRDGSGSTFKRVRQYAHGYVYLFALNPKYGEMELAAPEIIRAWRVVRHTKNVDKRRR